MSGPTTTTTTTSTTPDRFHWWATGANLWILAGLFLDGWSHITNPGEESFFTPWHGLLYSGVFAAVAVITAESLRRRRQEGLRFGESIPTGYGLSAVGGIVVLVGGAADGVWHTLFGVEVGVEALLSATHLTMAVAGALVAAGPLRAAWADRRPHAPLRWPAAVAVALTITLLGFFTQYVNPVSHRYAAMDGAVAGGSVDLVHAAGVAGFVLWAALLAAGVLLYAVRWRLPLGAVTLIVAVPSLFMATQRGTYLFVPAALAAGALGDAIAARWSPSPADRRSMRIVGTAVPALITTGLLVTTAVAGDLVWSIHMVSGAIVLSGAAGIFLSVLVAPPAVPSEVTDADPDAGSDEAAAGNHRRTTSSTAR